MIVPPFAPPSPGVHMSAELTLGSFAQGFVAKLIAEGQSGISPKAAEDRHGLNEVVKTLDKEIQSERANGAKDKEWFRSLVMLRNELRPSLTGAFDGFENALRNLQLSFTSCPNAFYEDIAFNVTRPFAESVVSELPDRQRNLIARAAEAFVQARKRARE